MHAARLQAAGCALQGCRPLVSHCKAAGCKAAGRKAARQKGRTWLLAAAKPQIALLSRLLLRRGDNAVLLKFGTPKSLHLPCASACNKQNLGFFRKSNGQQGIPCCKLQHGLLLGKRGSPPLGGRSLKTTLTLSLRLEGSRQPTHAEGRRI